MVATCTDRHTQDRDHGWKLFYLGCDLLPSHGIPNKDFALPAGDCQQPVGWVERRCPELPNLKLMLSDKSWQQRHTLANGLIRVDGAQAQIIKVLQRLHRDFDALFQWVWSGIVW